MAQLKDVWLEFEEYAEPVGGYFNMQIRLVDGRVYALNVWTFDFAGSVRAELDSEETYTIGPDLIVGSATRGTLEQVAEALIAKGELREAWRVVQG